MQNILHRIDKLPDVQKAFTIVVIGLLARMLLSLLIDPIARLGEGDDGYYFTLADSIRNGQYMVEGRPDFQRPPGYPLFIALSSDRAMVLIAQMILSLSIAVLVFRTLHNFWSAALIAACPFLIAFDLRFYSESLFITLLVASFMILFVSGWKRAIVGGFFLGFAILTRETLLMLPLVLIAAGFLLGRRRDMLIAAIAAYVCVAPWAARNANIPGGKFALSEGHPGFNLWIGTWERNGDWMRDGIMIFENYPNYAFRSPAEKQRLRNALPTWSDQPFADAAKARLTSEPLNVLSTWILRYPQMWIGTRTEQNTLRLTRGSIFWLGFKAAMLSLNFVILVSGVVGAIVALSKRCSYALFTVPVAYHAAIYIPFHNTEDRYTLPAIPFLIILAVYGVSSLSHSDWRRLGSKQA